MYALNNNARLTSIRVSSASSGTWKATGPSILGGDCANMAGVGGEGSAFSNELDLSLTGELTLSRLPFHAPLLKGTTVPWFAVKQTNTCTYLARHFGCIMDFDLLMSLLTRLRILLRETGGNGYIDSHTLNISFT